MALGVVSAVVIVNGVLAPGFALPLGPDLGVHFVQGVRVRGNVGVGRIRPGSLDVRDVRLLDGGGDVDAVRGANEHGGLVEGLGAEAGLVLGGVLRQAAREVREEREAREDGMRGGLGDLRNRPQGVWMCP